jgi:hypothetical protein
MDTRTSSLSRLAEQGGTQTQQKGNRMTEQLYTVFVGGTEVTNHFLPYDCAGELANSYREDGYDDVAIVAINKTEGNK